MKVGITGHRRFDDPSAAPWVENCIRERLQECKELCGLTSLAKGADQIFAQVVLDLGGRLKAVLPFAGYPYSFEDPEESAGFGALIGSCEKIVTLEFAGTKEQSYLAAGQYVADHTQLLIAVWDGKPAAGVGGTGDVVEYARREGKRVYQINPVERTAAEME